MSQGQSSDDFYEVPINVNGFLRVAKGTALTDVQVEEMVLAHFRNLIGKPHTYSESMRSYSFVGDVWRDQGTASVGDLRFEVRHNHALNVSGAAVAIAPAEGTFGAKRLRGRVTAYVTPGGAYITARDPKNDHEKVLCLVNVTEGDIACHVMEPTGVDGFSTEATPAVSVTFPDMCIALN